MSLRKYKYFLYPLCCVFVVACNDEYEENNANKQEETFIKNQNKHQYVSIVKQRENAIDNIEKLCQTFLDQTNNNQKFFSQFLLYYGDEQKKIIDEVVSSIYIHSHYARQNCKKLNYEAINYNIERLKEAKANCLFVHKLFSLAKKVGIDKKKIDEWKNYFPFEFIFKDLLDQYGWWISKFDFYSKLRKDAYGYLIDLSVKFLDEKYPGGVALWCKSCTLDNIEDLIKKNQVKTYVNNISYVSDLKIFFDNKKQNIKQYIEQYEKDPSDKNYSELNKNVFWQIPRK